MALVYHNVNNHHHHNHNNDDVDHNDNVGDGKQTYANLATHMPLFLLDGRLRTQRQNVLWCTLWWTILHRNKVLFFAERSSKILQIATIQEHEPWDTSDCTHTHTHTSTCTTPTCSHQHKQLQWISLHTRTQIFN